MSAQVELGWSNAELRAGAKAAEGIVRRSAAQMEGALNGLKKIDIGRLAGIGVAGYSFGRLASGIAEATLRADDNKQAMLAVEGSLEGVTRRLSVLRDLARSPGLGFDQVVEADVKLRSVGLSADTSARMIREVGNALTLVGKGKEELDGVLLAFTQIIAKGKVSAEEINQIAERVPQIREVLKSAFGTADTEAIQKMAIPMELFIGKTLDGFSNLARAAGGLRSTLDNLGDTINQALVLIGEGSAGNVKEVFEDLETTIQGNADTFRFIGDVAKTAIEGIISGFGTAKAAVDEVSTSVAFLGLVLEGQSFKQAEAAIEAMKKAKFAADVVSGAVSGAVPAPKIQGSFSVDSSKAAPATSSAASAAASKKQTEAADEAFAAAERLGNQQRRLDELKLSAARREMSTAQQMALIRTRLLDAIREEAELRSDPFGGDAARLIEAETRRVELQRELNDLARQYTEEQKRAAEEAARTAMERQNFFASPFGGDRELGQRISGQDGLYGAPNEQVRSRIIGVKYAGQLDPRFGLSGRPSGGLTGDYTPLAEHGPSRLDAFNAAQNQPSQFDLLQQRGRGGTGGRLADGNALGGGGPGAPLFNPAAASAPPAPGGDPSTVPDILRAMLGLWRELL